jgi:hypothetical protein
MGTQVINSVARNLSERDWYPAAAMGQGLGNTETLSSRGLRSAYVPSHIAALSRFKRTAPWLSAANERLIELTEREPDWDSYRALPASPDVAQRASTFLTVLAQAEALRAPDIGGLNDGAVQLEWHHRGRTVHITFNIDSQVSVFFRDAASHETWEAALSDDPARLAVLLAQVAG